jgi:hypothetical protein
MSSEQQGRQCICNWADCEKFQRAFKKETLVNDGDDPWRGELKQVRISQTVKSKAFRYAIKHHLGTEIDPAAKRIRIAPHHFARSALRQVAQLQKLVSKEQAKSFDTAEYGRDGERPHAEYVNLVTSLFRANQQTLNVKELAELKGQYVVAPVVTKTIVEAEYNQLDSNTARQRTSRVTRDSGGKSIAPGSRSDEAQSHEATFKTPGGHQVSTDEHKKVGVVTQAKTPMADASLFVRSAACPSACSNKEGGSDGVQNLLGQFETPVVQQGGHTVSAECAPDAFAPSSPPVAVLKERQDTPILFPTDEDLGDLFRIKFENLKRDEDQFLADLKVKMAINHIATNNAKRGPYELGEEKFFFVCIDAKPWDNECLRGCFGSKRRLDGRACDTCQHKRHLTARRESRKQKSMESGVDRTCATSKVKFDSLSPESKNVRLTKVARSRKNTIATCRRLRLKLKENVTLDREKHGNVFAVLKEAFYNQEGWRKGWTIKAKEESPK